MIFFCGTHFCVENKKKKTNTRPNTKFFSILKGRNNNLDFLRKLYSIRPKHVVHRGKFVFINNVFYFI